MRDGRATPQDQGSQAVVDVLDPQPGDRVLDVAAAPGGKATAGAERVGDDGSWSRPTSTPAGSGSSATPSRDSASTVVAAVVADGRQLPVAPGAFDRVLVDAPCSGLGVLRRRPDARWRLEPGSVDRSPSSSEPSSQRGRDRGAARRVARVLGVHAHPRRDDRRRRVGGRQPRRASRSCRRRARRGTERRGRRLLSHRPAPTGCSCSFRRHQ